MHIRAMAASAALVCVLAACGTSGGSEGSAATTVPTTRESTTTRSSTTAATTTTTMAPQQVYAAMQKEIDRACGEAIALSLPPDPKFDPDWGTVSSPEKLLASTQRRVHMRKARAATTTTAPPTTAPPTTAPPATAPPQTAPASVYYPNCAAARAAGAAPLHRGDPGYAPHLDRDDDGVACE